jgi:protein arginine kinase
MEYETAARRKLLATEADVLDDKIARAMALLKNAHLISSQEAMLLLSHLRLGVNMHDYMGASTPAIEELCSIVGKGADQRPAIAKINKLFMLTLPAHLQLNYGKALDPTHRDVLRAKILRAALAPEVQ